MKMDKWTKGLWQLDMTLNVRQKGDFKMCFFNVLLIKCYINENMYQS